jgi:hypothetical protein
MNGTGDDIDRPETNLKEIQVVIINDGDFDRYRPLLGKDVQVTGTLFHAHTIHHRTPVLITLQRIDSQKKTH